MFVHVCVVWQVSGLTASQVLRTVGCRIRRLLTSYRELLLAVAQCTGRVQVSYFGDGKEMISFRSFTSHGFLFAYLKDGQ